MWHDICFLISISNPYGRNLHSCIELTISELEFLRIGKEAEIPTKSYHLQAMRDRRNQSDGTQTLGPDKAKDKFRESPENHGIQGSANTDWWIRDRDYEKTLLTCPKKSIIFTQGQKADSVFYIQSGKVKLAVVSKVGKEAVVGILESGAFFGETCLTGNQVYMASAIALEDASLIRVGKQEMIRLLHEKPTFSEAFMAHLLTRNVRIQEDLVDQLFNSSEKRLARVLLLLAHFGKEGKPETVIPKISQETLAEMIGTTRSRVSFFMNKFRKMGFIDYNGELHIHSSLLNIILHD
jgi:CRP/FNR family transcriptional regulator, cyclic AMP receptor protein